MLAVCTNFRNRIDTRHCCCRGKSRIIVVFITILLLLGGAISFLVAYFDDELANLSGLELTPLIPFVMAFAKLGTYLKKDIKEWLVSNLSTPQSNPDAINTASTPQSKPHIVIAILALFLITIGLVATVAVVDEYHHPLSNGMITTICGVILIGSYFIWTKLKKNCYYPEVVFEEELTVLGDPDDLVANLNDAVITIDENLDQDVDINQT